MTVKEYTRGMNRLKALQTHWQHIQEAATKSAATAATALAYINAFITALDEDRPHRAS